eukprot:COSAG03_NODE_783_length_5875_cov_59.263677_3_plen_488_part_00
MYLTARSWVALQGGIARGDVLVCVKAAQARQRAELDSALHIPSCKPGEEVDVQEVRRLEGGMVRVRVLQRGVIVEGVRKRARGCAWITLTESDGTACFVKQDRGDAKPELYLCDHGCGYEGRFAEVAAHEADCTLKAADPKPKPERKLEPEPEPEPKKKPAPEPKKPGSGDEVVRTRQVKLQRKGNGETPWLLWPRGKLVVEDEAAPASLESVPWEEQAELLQKQGWRFPTRMESLMHGELVNYNIYVSGYGPGRVLKFFPVSFGPSEHQVLFDDERFKKARVALRRKGNQMTPWMVMPGLLHRRPGTGPGTGGSSWDDDDNADDDDDDDDDGWEWEGEDGQADETAHGEASPVEPEQLVPVEEDQREAPVKDHAAAACSPVLPPLPALSAQSELWLMKVQALVRGKLLRTMLLKSQQKRRRIAQELLMTEDTYVKGLRGLVNAYVRPLQALAGTDKEVLSTGQIRTMFSGRFSQTYGRVFMLMFAY